jgi:predicted ferric reductase
VALGQISGLLAVYFVLLQVVFVGRNPWIEQTFGLDRLTRIHHWNAFLTIFFILLHPTFITIGYAWINETGISAQFRDLLLNYDDVLNAFIAVLVFTGIVFLSLYIVRQRLKYEIWYYIHLATYLAIILAWGHQLKLGNSFTHNKLFAYYWYLLYGGVLGSLIIFRFLRPIFNFWFYRFYVSNVIKETNSTTSIYISGRNIGKFRIAPGQFMILRFLSKELFWQAHPFSLSYVPKNNELRVSIKNVGDFTSEIPSVKLGTSVIVDGPYGIFTKKSATRNKFLFIAGGIGITPIRAMIEDLKGQDGVLIYGNRSEKDVVFKNELDNLAREHGFAVHHVISDEKRRVTIDLIQKLAPNLKEREIYICGPKPMMKQLIGDFRNLGLEKKQIHYEEFSLQ